jgi:hypothetical protein
MCIYKTTSNIYFGEYLKNLNGIRSSLHNTCTKTINNIQADYLDYIHSWHAAVSVNAVSTSHCAECESTGK